MIFKTLIAFVGAFIISSATYIAASSRTVDIKDQFLVKYFNEFKAIYEITCHKPFSNLIPEQGAVIRMHDLPEQVIGLCENRGSSFRISFSPKYFAKFNITDIRSVFWHESLHCFFDEPHSSNPKHFMAPYYSKIDQQTLNKQLIEYLGQHCDYKKD